LSISSSSTTALPFSVVSELPVFTDLKVPPPARRSERGDMWPAWVAVIVPAADACCCAWSRALKLNGFRSSDT